VVAGDDEPVPVAARPAMQAVRDEPDVRRKIAMFAEGLSQRQARSARVQILIRDGRNVEDSLAPVWAKLNDEGLAGTTMLARHLLQTGQLRDGIDPGEIRDVLWNYLAVDTHERLVLIRGLAARAILAVAYARHYQRHLPVTSFAAQPSPDLVVTRAARQRERGTHAGPVLSRRPARRGRSDRKQIPGPRTCTARSRLHDLGTCLDRAGCRLDAGGMADAARLAVGEGADGRGDDVGGAVDVLGDRAGRVAHGCGYLGPAQAG
jgi:hypothetical protein